MKHPYLIDLNNAENWINPQALYRDDGSLDEEMRTINMPEGPHRLFAVTDSVLHRVGEGEINPFHVHLEGWEYFYVSTGKGFELFIDSKSTHVGPGNFIFFQPYQAHGVRLLGPTRNIGFFHDLRNIDHILARVLLKEKRPEHVNLPDYKWRFLGSQHDEQRREIFDYTKVPVEEVRAVRNIDRPMDEFNFEGVSMRMITARYENGGVNELWGAVMEPGFYVEWEEYPNDDEMFLVTEGEVRFKVYDDEFVAYPECFVRIPRFAHHSITALTKAVVYDIGGLTHWQAFLQDRSAVKRDPARADKPEIMEELKKKYRCQIKCIGKK
jgi:mannose-6-phosphate isomerase-like protein (cupin superfamily)